MADKDQTINGKALMDANASVKNTTLKNPDAVDSPLETVRKLVTKITTPSFPEKPAETELSKKFGAKLPPQSGNTAKLPSPITGTKG